MRSSSIATLLLLTALVGVIAGALGALFWSPDRDVTGVPLASDAVDTMTSEPATPLLAEPAGGSVSRSRQNAITQAAARVGPAVVAVSIVQTRVVRARSQRDDFWSRFLFPRYYREQVRSIGSGVIVSEAGYILTNEHVTEDADSVWVTLSDGRTLPARLVGSDHETDLAVLRVPTGDLPVADLGDSDSLLIGEWAIALGNPFGYLLVDSKPSVTVGVISATERDLRRSADDERVYRKVIQTDAAINPGNSGGPLVNAQGQVIGINAFIFSSNRGSDGIGFAIPVNQARVVFADLVQYGEVRPAWVGVRLQSLSALLRRFGPELDARGVVVTGVQPHSPATRAGLQPEDIIRRVNDRPIRNLADWEGEAAYWRAGQDVELTVERDGSLRSLRLSLVERPLLSAASTAVGYGMWATDLNQAIASQLALSNARGAVITKVEPGSPADQVGIQRGDVIRQVNNALVSGAADLSERLAGQARGMRRVVGLEREGRLYLTALEP
jgi:serine protease Do